MSEFDQCMNATAILGAAGMLVAAVAGFAWGRIYEAWGRASQGSGER